MRNKMNVLVVPADKKHGGLALIAAIKFLEKFDVVIIEQPDTITTSDYKCLILTQAENEDKLKRAIDTLKKARIDKFSAIQFGCGYHMTAFVYVHEPYPKIARSFILDENMDVFFYFGAPVEFPPLRSDENVYVLGDQEIR